MEEGIPLTKKEKRALAREEKQKWPAKASMMAIFKRILLWTVIFGAVIFLGYKLVNLFNNPSISAYAERLNLRDTDWFRGKREAKAILIEYGDFQCPACGSYYPLIKKLEAEFPDNLVVVYRHFPLVNTHPNAYPTAIAAEAAGKQGKFWEMHDILFENQAEWSGQKDTDAIVLEYAKRIGLDLDKFSGDIKNADTEAKIKSNMEEGTALGINSTPTFYLNGKKLANPRSYDEFKNKIEAVLQN
jgi:protein-disulfide isomerase